jgi:hypothetical protein
LTISIYFFVPVVFALCSSCYTGLLRQPHNDFAFSQQSLHPNDVFEKKDAIASLSPQFVKAAGENAVFDL